MMKKYILLCMFCFLCFGCLGIIDESQNKPVTDINRQSLLGKWKADRFSYQFDFNEEKIDSMDLVLYKDGTFVMHNGIKVTGEGGYQLTNYRPWKQVDFSGTWELGKRTQKGYKDQYEIKFHIGKEKNKYLPNYYSHQAPIYKNKDKYRIFIFIGDPDSGNALSFRKTIQKTDSIVVP